MSKTNYLIIIWIAFIIFVSFVRIPQGEGPQLFPYTDKVVHLFLYFILGILLSSKNTNPLWLWLFAAFLGGSIEILQGLLTSYRSADFWDFMADMAGFAIGLYHHKLLDIFK